MTMSAKQRMSGWKMWLVLAVVIGICGAALELGGLREELIPGEARIQKELRDLKQAQAQLSKELALAADLKLRRDSFVAETKDFWIPQRDGKPETEIPKEINQAAKLTGLKISSLGDIRQIKAGNGIYVMELSLTSTDSLEAVTRFMAEIYRASPKFRWQRCQIRPDGAKDSRKVNFSGSISFICVSDERMTALLGVEGGKG